jgi:hypothetical protein
MNYLEAFLKEKTRAEKPDAPTAKTDKSPSGSFVSESLPKPSTGFSMAPVRSERNRWSQHQRASVPLRLCGALVCPKCHTHSPSPHRADCADMRFEPCGSRWFWLSPHGAIKCVACSAPDDLGLIEAWVLARETDGGENSFTIPSEILLLLNARTVA